jgi:hypothetical protein
MKKKLKNKAADQIKEIQLETQNKALPNSTKANEMKSFSFDLQSKEKSRDV